MTSTTEEEIIVKQVHPNPLVASSQINLFFPKSAEANVTLYTMDGRPVQKLANRTFSAGKHIIPIDVTILSNGYHILTVESNGKIPVMKN